MRVTSKMKRVALTVVMLVLTATLGFAQIFPEEKTLDVVYVSDGSVLRGRIIEDFVDSHVKIEVFGGSTFMIAYEHIDAIEEVTNPDYNTRWIRIAIDDARDNVSDDKTSEDEERPFLGQGWLVGLHGVFGTSGRFPWDSRGLSGGDIDAMRSDLDDEDSVGELGGGGLYGAFLRPWSAEGPDRFLWGVRSGVGFYYTSRRLNSRYADEFGDGENVEQEVVFFDIPAEGLIGIGGPRAFVYLSAGFSLSIITSTPDDSWENDPAIYDFPTLDNPVNAGVIGSVGTMFRLGSNWTGEFRIFFQRQLTSWYSDFEQYFDQVPGLSLGVAYHRKR